MTQLQYLKNVVTLEYSEEKCIGCCMCEMVCPHGVFVVEGSKAIITDKDNCMECGACEKNCPVDAITVRSGVGCAAGIISGTVGGAGSDCSCAVDLKELEKGTKKSGNPDNGKGSGGSCCCG